MSFVCFRCGKPQDPRVKPKKVVIRWRELAGNYDHPDIRQIAEERDFCETCAEKVETKTERQER